MSTEIFEYYEELAGRYDEDRFGGSYGQFIHSQEKSFLERFLSPYLYENVLSLACGTGRLMEFATHGADYSPKMITVATSKFPNKQFSITDASETQFKTDQFNGIFSFHLFMHLDHEMCRRILAESSRITKKGGHFIFDFPSAYRRKKLSQVKENWHGGNQLTIEELPELIGPAWKIISYEGVAFLPIHRFPQKIRKWFLFLDNLLCRSPLKRYASYLVVVLVKQ